MKNDYLKLKVTVKMKDLGRIMSLVLEVMEAYPDLAESGSFVRSVERITHAAMKVKAQHDMKRENITIN